MMYVMPDWSVGGMAMRLLRLAAVVLVGVVVYFGVLGLLGFKIKDYARS